MDVADSDAARQVVFEKLPELRRLIREVGLVESDLAVASPPPGASCSDVHFLVRGDHDAAAGLTKKIGSHYGIPRMRLVGMYVEDEEEPRWLISSVTVLSSVDPMRFAKVFADHLGVAVNDKASSDYEVMYRSLRRTLSEPDSEGSSHIFARSNVTLVCHLDAGSTRTASVRISTVDQSSLSDAIAAGAASGQGGPWHFHVEAEDEAAGTATVFVVSDEKQTAIHLMHWVNALLEALKDQGIDATIDHTQDVEALEIFKEPHPGAVHDEATGAYVRRLRPRT